MKTHFIKSLMLIILLAVASPAVSLATVPSVNPVENKEEKANRLTNRLEEIRSMDTKKLSREEKKALRVEVRAIKKELKAISGGVYLSVGAILLIALLIILLA